MVGSDSFSLATYWRRARRSSGARRLGLIIELLLLAIASAVAVRAQGTGYWHTSGSQILDSQNKTVRIAGINWYGFETPDAVVHGLYSQDYNYILNTIAIRGYNTIRLPYSNQMVENPLVPTSISFSSTTGPINTDLKGLNSLQVMDRIIAAAGKLGLKVILDNHRSEAGASNEESGLWYTAAYPETKWIADWKLLAARYKTYTDPNGNPTVIGMDLRNEPHLIGLNNAMTGSCWTGDSAVKGCPVTNTAQNWPAAAARAGNAILASNAGLLIFVEGSDCFDGDCGWQGANLEGAGAYPVKLTTAGHLVYSAHDYGPDLFAQPWFSAKTTPGSLGTIWNKYWGYLSNGGTAPVWIGEFGTTNASADVETNKAGSQGQWFESLIAYLGNHPALGWSYWALNGEDSFALLDTTYDEVPVSSLKEQLLESVEFPLDGGYTESKACKAAPAVATGVKAVASSTSALAVSWTAVTPPTGCAVSYSVFRGTASGFTAAAANQVASGLTTAAFSDTGLAAATKYYYVVKVADLAGTSAASAAGNGTTQAVKSTAGASCHVSYAVTASWSGGFQTAITIYNTGGVALTNWTLVWNFAQDQTVASVWNATETQVGKTVTLKNVSYDGSIAPGANWGGIGFTANVGAVNSAPASFMLNGVVCQ